MKKFVFLGLAILVLGGIVFSQQNAGPARFRATATVVERGLSFEAGGRVAVFEVTVLGSGILSVDTEDYNPAMFPDYWRVTIVQLGAPGAGGSKVIDLGATNALTALGPTYAGRADFPVSSAYKYLVLINDDRWTIPELPLQWPAGMYVRFTYTGASFTVSEPRPGF